ncbi:MAG: hypothetical protein JSV46_09895 [Candidatus Aminicenantes bacterium]|nr:MAG: hypothetical protein JSV46_09895 [Candidatus Aminicenantes bacterium]
MKRRIHQFKDLSFYWNFYLFMAVNPGHERIQPLADYLHLLHDPVIALRRPDPRNLSRF